MFSVKTELATPLSADVFFKKPENNSIIKMPRKGTKFQKLNTEIKIYRKSPTQITKKRLFFFLISFYV